MVAHPALESCARKSDYGLAMARRTGMLPVVERNQRQPDQFDSPWQEALEVYRRSILEFCFPAVARAIDWAAGIEFLD